VHDHDLDDLAQYRAKLWKSRYSEDENLTVIKGLISWLDE